MDIKYSVGGQSGDKEDGQQLTESEPCKTNAKFASYLCCVEGESGGCQVAFLLNENELEKNIPNYLTIFIYTSQSYWMSLVIA